MKKRLRESFSDDRGKTTPGVVSLARALSKRGLASRTEARALIAAGRVSVDGRVVTNPDLRVVPEQIRIAIDGVSARPRAATRLLALNKPRGTVTSRHDPEGRRTVFEVLGGAGDGLIAVGRLDLASSGLLLFTNDTQLANRLTDPANGVERRYLVTVRGRVEPDIAARLSEADAVRVQIRKASNRETHLIVTLTEGKNREIRRMFAAVGHEVTRLHRVTFGEVKIGELQPGEWRDVK